MNVIYMYELYPYFTNDGSVGLFSPEANDIYHSTYGALTEAYEKFILPSDFENYFRKNSEIKILDICFGIGYNSKSFINILLDLIYNETIDTNNNSSVTNNDKIYTNNKKYKISIHAIDTDKILATLSPFFKTFEKNIRKYNSKSEIIYKQEKIRKLSANKAVAKYKLKDEVNILLLKSIFNQINKDTISILKDKKFKQYFNRKMIRLFEFYQKQRSIYTPLRRLNVFLHNIYYKYLSKGYKSAFNTLQFIDFDFNLEINDARQAIKNDKTRYNFVFLDAFTPTKCPCLWSLEFFKLLYDHLEDNGMILTYSNSAQVRNCFENAGFIVKKIFSKSQNKYTGTVAIKPSQLNSNNPTAKLYNPDLIKDLSEYDLGLMKTRAGIFYRDKDLSLDNEAIINNHKIEVENSNLISSTKFIKNYKKCHN